MRNGTLRNVVLAALVCLSALTTPAIAADHSLQDTQSGSALTTQAGVASLSVSAGSTTPGGEVTVTFDLTNTGDDARAYILEVAKPSDVTIVDQSGPNWDGTDSWLWQTIEPDETKTASVVLSVPEDGTSFDVTGIVKVSDGVATEVTERVDVDTQNQAPDAAFEISPTTPTVGDSITLDGGQSSDPDGAITSYAWDLDGDGNYDDATGEQTTKTVETAGSHEIGLRVTDNNGATDTVTQSISVNANAHPSAAITANTTSIAQGETVLLNASTSDDPDGTITEYRWDTDGDGTIDQTTTTPTVTVTMPEASTHQLAVTVVDDMGAIDTATLTVEVSDTTSPTASFHLNTSSPIDIGTDVRLNATAASDNVGITDYRWSVPAGSPSDLTGETATVTLPTLGEHAIELTVEDAAGNSDQVTKSVTVQDLDTPRINMISPPEGDISPDTNLTIRVTDETLARGTVNITGSSGIPTKTVPTSDQSLRLENLSFTGEGPQTVTVNATDASGNTATKTFEYHVVDSPRVTIDQPLEDTVLNGSTVVTATYSDAISSINTSSVRLAVDGTAVELPESATRTKTALETPLPALSEGQHTLTVSAADSAGFTTNATVNITVDTTAPDIAFETTPADPLSRNAPGTATIHLADQHPATASVDIMPATGGAPASYTTDISSAFPGESTLAWNATTEAGRPVPSGTYTVAVTATDEAGNMETIREQVHVDNTPPTIAVGEVAADSRSVDGATPATLYTNGSLTVAGTANGTASQLSELAVAINATFTNFANATALTPSESWDTSMDLSGLPDDGRYRVTATARDAAANTNQSQTTAVVVLDRQPPTLGATVSRMNETTARVNLTTTGPLRDKTVNVTVKPPSGDARTVPVTQVDDRYTGTFSLAEQDGQYTVTATGQDRAGNLATETSTATMRNVSTENQTVTVRSEVTGAFVQFNTTESVNNTFVTLTESDAPLDPLTADLRGATFLNGQLGTRLSDNLSNATIGIPVAEDQLPAGASASEVTIRRYNASQETWVQMDTSVRTVTLADGTTDRYWVATVPHFSTYGAVVEDTTPPTLESKTPTATLPYGKTNATIRFEYKDVGTGVNASAVALTFDGEEVTTSSNATITSEYASFNATDLTPGRSYTAEATVTDEAGESATYTTSFTVAEDAAGPEVTTLRPRTGSSFTANTSTVTITAEYSDDASGIATSATQLYFNGSEVTSAASITDSQLSYTARDLQPNTTNSGRLVLTDQAGHTTTQPFSFTINATAATREDGSGSGGGGGGGMGGSEMKIDHGDRGDHHVVTVTSPESFTVIPLEISDGARTDGLGVQQLGLRSIYGPEEMKMYLYEPTDAPEGDIASLTEGTAVAYLRVELRWTDPKYMDAARLRFSVPESALPDGASASQVTLYQYRNGEWQALETTPRSGTTYQAQTGTLGQFAIGIAPTSETTSGPSTTTQPATETTSPPATTTQPAPETTTSAQTTTEPSEQDDDGTGTFIPGFGLGTAIIALCAVAALLVRREA
jgi:PGF-CTERM protein